MQPTNPTPRPKGGSDTSTLNASARAGAARHHKKVAAQSSQLKGGGATTGGFATSPGAPVVPNKSGKFLAKGKN